MKFEVNSSAHILNENLISTDTSDDNSKMGKKYVQS